jgi:inosine-uridine nucleoside N-ribohydrolase
MKIILDTDIGTDIDDVFALAFALRHPDIQLEAITTVTGYPVERAQLVHHLLGTVNRADIPVASGAALPMYSLDPHGRKAYLERKPNHTQVAKHVTRGFPKGEAVRLILDTVDKHAGEISIVAIGPLTNIAHALTVDPELPHKIRFLAIMGGDLNLNKQEYNVVMDPEASDLVYRCGAEMFLATWEISRQVVILPEHLDTLRQASDALCSEIIRCTELWWPYRRDKPGPVVYDISPLLWLLDRSWFQTQHSAMRVETNNPHLRGLTYIEPDGESKLHVSTQFNDPEKARHLMMELLLSPS